MEGLANEDIRRQVLGIVEEMDLDDALKYILTKKSGNQAGAYLDNWEAVLNRMTAFRQALVEDLKEPKIKPEGPGHGEDIVGGKDMELRHVFI